MLNSASFFLGVARRKCRGLLWHATGLLRDEVTVRTKQGRLTIQSRDAFIGHDLFVHRHFEWDVSKHVTEWMQAQRGWTPGVGTLLDIGANMGVISVGMLHHGLFKRAIAIEPEPRNFSLLERNVAQNRLHDRVTCLPLAVGASPGELAFELSETNFGDHRIRDANAANGVPAAQGELARRTTTVPVDTLDNVLESRVGAEARRDIALVWIDIQGFEAFAFRGGRKLFSEDVPVVAEVWPYGMRRVGVSEEDMQTCASQFWSSYWVFRRGRFVRYPITSFPSFLDELGPSDGASENVIFTK